MENTKRLKEFVKGNGMTEDNLKVFTKKYFDKECVRWFYFDLSGDIPKVIPEGNEIDIVINHIDYPQQVTIELALIKNDSNSEITYGRLASELILKLRTKSFLTEFGPKFIDGIALTIGKDDTEEFLLLELYIKNKVSGEIVIIRPFFPLVGDNLTPTSIPPGK
ncbi:hypothetical protein [Emticicia sp. BO119]|uniref:hypothetical protein n=1 Tax=Emticicia sp. BO119 TaxID=2757768 RepID=UPI0015F0D2C1|nr:hypothetical protein [Emticicia sp. BO119]MBA4848778.1 hypothetical protein [Emticicia sp. BO119]